MVSILSKEPDGAGYYYGWYKGAFVNVKADGQYYVVYVDDYVVTSTARTKAEGEKMAIAYVDGVLVWSSGPDKGSRWATWLLVILFSILVVLAPLMFR